MPFPEEYRLSQVETVSNSSKQIKTDRSRSTFTPQLFVHAGQHPIKVKCQRPTSQRAGTHIPNQLWWMSENRMSPLTFTRSNTSGFDSSLQYPRTLRHKNESKKQKQEGGGTGRESGYRLRSARTTLSLIHFSSARVILSGTILRSSRSTTKPRPDKQLGNVKNRRRSRLKAHVWKPSRV